MRSRWRSIRLPPLVGKERRGVRVRWRLLILSLRQRTTYVSEAVSLFCRCPLACSSGHRQRLGQTSPLGQLEEVVDGADDGTPGAYFFEAAQMDAALDQRPSIRTARVAADARFSTS